MDLLMGEGRDQVMEVGRDQALRFLGHPDEEDEEGWH
jgi:hypothetical protein